MPLIDVHSSPSDSMRKWFGLSLGILLAILAFTLVASGLFRQIMLGVAVAVAVVYYAFPVAKLPVIRTWQMITFPLAWVIGHLLFGVVFFVIVTPIGFFLRLFRYDPLRLRDSDETTSLWKERPNSDEAGESDSSRYFRQY